MSRWFRFYGETLNNAKVQRLPGDLFKAWVNLLCLASAADGVIPKGEDIAFALRMMPEEADDIVAQLLKRNLLEDRGEFYVPHNWDERQFKSDTSTNRVREHRSRSTKQDETVSCNVSETPPETEQSRTETEQTSASPAAAPSRSRKKQAIRLPDDWQPDQSARDYASRQGLSSGEIAREVEKFRNHARANDRTASDWGAAWRNWCVKAAEFMNKPPPADPSAPEQQLFPALPGSPSFLAWKRHCASRDEPASRTMKRQLELRELEGRPYEFPSEWPPGYVKTTEAA